MVLALAPLAGTLASCGSGNGQLKVSISDPGDNVATSDTHRKYDVKDSGTYAQYKPGDQAAFTVTVTNTGPGSVSGVTIHALLPSAFRYRSTEGIDASGATRTQPVDASVNTNSPIFGLWTLGPPGTAGATTPTSVSITFVADVGGQPGKVVVNAFAAGDATAGQTDAAPYSLQVNAAPHMAALVSVNPTSAKAGATVTYDVRLTNDGTGNASNVAMLLTLPPTLTFVDSVIPFPGNGTRNQGVNPFRNTLLVYYNGFLLPPLSNGGPGFVVIRFTATVVAGAPAGSYPVDVNVTDDSGANISLHAVAALTIH